MNRYMNVLLLSTLMMHGACAMSYFFGNGAKEKTKNSEIEQVRKRIFAVHELSSVELTDTVSPEKFIEAFNALPEKKKIKCAQQGTIFNNPTTGQIYRSLAQLSPYELHSIC